MEDSRSRLLPALALGLVVLFSLGTSLRGDFVWDDAPLITENRLVQDPGRIVDILTSSFWETGDRHDRFRAFFRPLVALSYALDYRVWGPRPAGFHLTNLLLHFGICWLIYRLALAEGVGPRGSLAGAALFAAHPVHVESVTWISGRTDLLCALFLLASLLVHRAGRLGLRLGRRTWIAWLLFGLALFSKEMAATLPALVFADAWLTARSRRRRLADAVSSTLPFVVVLGCYLVARLLVLGQGTEPLYRLAGPAFLTTALFVLARYVTLLLVPVGLDAHYPYAPLDGVLSPLVLLAAGMLLVVAWSAIRFARNSPRAGVWIGWLFVSLLPVLAFGRFGDVVMADRFLYIPSVALAMLLARGLAPFLDGPCRQPVERAVAAGAALALLVFGLLSFQRVPVWRDDRTLFSDMLRTSPASALVRNNLGLTYYKTREYGRAIEEFRLAVDLAPGYALAHNNLAAALEQSGELDEALSHYRHALRLAPGLVEAGANAGSLLVRLGRHEEGERLLRQLVALNPGHPGALYALADALDRTGHSLEALTLAEQVREIDPRLAAAHYLLGKIRHARGESARAAESMRRFLELWEDEGEHAESARRIIAQASSAHGPELSPPAVTTGQR